MPNSTRNALWFVNNTILVRFKEQSKAKNFAIKACNDFMLKGNNSKNVDPKTKSHSSQSSNSNSCFACNSIFNTQSKPSRCDSCSKYFHKTSCLKYHTKICQPRKQINTSDNKANEQSTNETLTTATGPSSIQSESTPAFNSSSSISQLRTTLTFVPERSLIEKPISYQPCLRPSPLNLLLHQLQNQ